LHELACHELSCVRHRRSPKHEHAKPGRLPWQVVLVAWMEPRRLTAGHGA
jgi:hypothetical protein